MKAFFDPRGVFKTRNLVIMALMVALSTVLSALETYVDPAQKLYSFAYLPRAMVALTYGPWAAIVVAFVSDFTSFLTDPRYGYFVGYALSAVVTDFFCALLLYRREITVWRVAIARLLVIVFVTFGLNSLWQIAYYGMEAGKFFTGFRVVRNLVQFPLDVYLVTTMGRYMRKFAAGTWK